ncbi:uncharacterized protein PHALS_09409 [Plasmopara halstedii]|uniref:Uncharacterized protein n=1 Tax=Plasmopara halstedii TaxID=4781 RepID=A0A0P1A509_PLAHL|nr:uncharacterized protein PHALS_09409 [Plasmopara halstedii]CEG35282.1 hypothetical protein PHALS_09409 [Plasmopara halstedii]|eukprot:XP_024571651.1 hypothetical protein PHALS_09409 [Plasmopara halstedii]
MWAVLFGDNENETGSTHSIEETVKMPVSPQHSTPPATPSPLQSSAPSTPPSFLSEQRVNPVVDAKSTKSGSENDDSAMKMLLKRLNNLMVKVGEHEFEKRTLVDQMEKERKILTAKIAGLEKEMEDLKDQNVQLQYKVEYTSEPMLMERVQDITDMRDALAAVKKQLELELQEKDVELKKLKAAVATKDKEQCELRDDYQNQFEELIAEREAARKEAADAIQVASKVAGEKYEEQLREKDMALSTIIAEKAMLEASLTEKEQALCDSKAVAEDLKSSLDEAQTQRMMDVNALEQLQLELDRVSQEYEKLQRLKMEGQHELETLENQVKEHEGFVAKSAQELEDYKHDCVELWKINEELKQQIASMSADTIKNQAELREKALSGQSVLENKVVDLEKQLEELQEKLDCKNQEVAKLVELDNRTRYGDEASIESDRLAVVGGDTDIISVLTEQVATAQRELTEAMELNLHLNNRNAWLEEQYQMLSSVQSEGDEEHEEAGIAKPSPEKRIMLLEQELQEVRRAANEKAEHISNLEHNCSALSTEFDRLHSAHDELIKVKQIDEEALNTLKQEIELLRASQTDAVEKGHELFLKEQEIAKLGCEIKRLQNIENQLQHLHEKFRKAQTDLAETQGANAILQQELAALQDIAVAASKSDEKVALIQNELSQARSEKDAIVNQLTQSEASVNELKLKIQEFECTVNNQKIEIKSLEQQLQNLQDMAQENMENSFELQSSLETTMEDLANAQAHLRTEQENCASLRQSIAEIEQSSIPRADLDRAQREIAQLEQQISQFHSKEQSLEQQLLEAEHSKNAIAADLQTALSERVAAEQEQKRLQEFYEHKLSSAQSSLNELQCANDDLSRSMEQSQAKATQAEEQLNAMRAHHNEVQKKLETLTKKNLSLISEIQSMRDEIEKQQQVSRSQVAQLKSEHADVQRQLAETTQRLQSKDAELAAESQRNQSNVAQHKDLLDRYKAEKMSSDQQLAQLNGECENLRQAHNESTSAMKRSQHELEQIRAQLAAMQQEKYSLETELGQLRGLNDEKAHLIQTMDEYKRVNQRLEGTNRELEGLLQKSKAYCEDLSRESDKKVSRIQEFARHVEQEARDEIDRIVNENNMLRDELEQLAQARFDETNAHDELRVKLAELQAENNVLSARAHRLTQQLSQYTDLPDDDELAAAGQGQAPDLWELLSSGMEQLKADLELASKYAASIDASSVDGGIGDDSFTVSN